MVFKCDKYSLRQLFIMSSVWLQGMGCGVILAYPTVLKEINLSSNSTDSIMTSEQTSWLVASVGIYGVFGFIIFSSFLQIFGRKIVHIIVVTFYLTSWIIFYFANNIYWLYIGRSFHGLSMGITYINGVIISEYCTPETRGYYITLMKMSISVGSLLCHGLSFWSYREVAIAGMVLAVVGLVLNLFWPESPSHEAMKGRFDKCKKSFKWLHGSSPEKRKELAELISAQMEGSSNKTKENIFKAFLKAFKDKGFQKAVLIASLLTLVVDSSGRFFVIAYITQIMMELVGSGTAVYYSICVDCLALTAFFMSFIILKFMKRRTILFVFGILTGLLMFSINLVSFLKTNNIGSDNAWLSPFLIILQNFIVNLTMIPVCYTFFGEIFPLDHRGIGSCMSGIVFAILYGINLKVTPMMMKDLGLGGTYGAYGVSLFLSLFVLYFVVPETKNKTLQEIEDEIKGVKRNKDVLIEKLNEDVDSKRC